MWHKAIFVAYSHEAVELLRLFCTWCTAQVDLPSAVWDDKHASVLSNLAHHHTTLLPMAIAPLPASGQQQKS